MKFEVYKSGIIHKEWRWRCKARNGQIIASGEGYKSKGDAVHAIYLLITEGPKAVVEF